MLESLHGKPSGGGINANKSLVVYNDGNTNGIVSSENCNYGKPVSSKMFFSTSQQVTSLFVRGVMDPS